MIADVLASNDNESIWSFVKKARADYLEKILPSYIYKNDTCRMIIPGEDVMMNLNKTSSLLKLSNISDEIKNISKSTIIFGAKLYIYLNSCYRYQYYWKVFLDIYLNKEASAIVLVTFKIISNDLSDDGTMIAKKFIKYLASSFGFQFLNSVENRENQDSSIIKNIVNVKA